VITVQDTTAPAFTFVPADYTVECSDDMPMEDATASDNCGTVTVAVSNETIEGNATGNYTITRTFTATDDAGNSATATQVITVQDTTPPSFSSTPSNIVLECTEMIPIDLNIAATDECSNVTISASSELVPGINGDNYQVLRSFVATDEAGNTSTFVQTITVQDSTAPEFTYVPADYTIECSEAPTYENAMASDNCSSATISIAVDTTFTDALGNYTITRTFTAVDDSGNSANVAQVITVVDTTAPEYTFVPADYTVECSDTMPMASAEAADLCGLVTISLQQDTIFGACAGEYTITRTFIATDDAGNSSASVMQSITVIDTTAPSIDVGAMDETVECNGAFNADQLSAWLSNQAGASASDLCGTVTWSNDFTTLEGSCGTTASVMVTFTATDDCGNASNTMATFTIEDTTAPSMDVAASNLTVECDGAGNNDALNAWLASNGDAMASDICGNVTWSHDFTALSDECGATGSAAVTFTATDDCGNATSTTATFTIEDTTAPSLDAEATGLTVECDGAGNSDALNAWLASNGDAMASDICGNVSWSHDFTALSDGCGAAGSAAVTFTATDDCGNATSTTATFTIEDTTAPSMDVAASDMTVECDGDGNTGDLNAWLASNGDAMASDICGNVTWSHDFTAFSDECGATGSASVTFTATDDCGNATSTTATFTIEDTTAPSIDVMASDLVVECDGEGNVSDLNAWLASNGDAMASDICGNVTWSHDFESLSDECGLTGSATVIFTATDDCGNASTTSATFTIEDTTGPEITAPSDYSAECSDELVYAEATAFDGCLNCMDVYESSSSVAGYELTFERIAEHEEGELAGLRTYRVYLNLDDATDRLTSLTGDDAYALELATTTSFYQHAAGSVTPNGINETVLAMIPELAYDSYVTVGLTGTPVGEQTEVQLIPGAWSESFEAGESIVVNDGIGSGWYVWPTSPNGLAGDDKQILIAQLTTDGEISAQFRAQIFPKGDQVNDIRAELALTHNRPCTSVEETQEIIAGDAAGNYSIVRTFTASDFCGNESTATQIITLVDTTAPEFTSVPADYTVECSDDMPMEDAAAADNCGEVSIAVESTTTEGDAAGNYTITRTFTATDDAGNSSSAVQTITVVDTTAPEFTSVPADYTVECSDEMPMEDASASDNCGAVTIEVSSEITEGDATGNYTITRTFTATDDAGNSSSAVQTITVVDTTAPEFTFVPADESSECGEAWSTEMATANDNCGDVSVTVEETTEEGACAGLLIITRTFTATDDAGNSTTAIQTITQVDTTAPSLSVATDITIECSEEVPAPASEATDSCSDVDVTVTEEVLAGSCPQESTILRTYTAADGCGNETSAVQTISIVDTTAPEFIETEPLALTVYEFDGDSIAEPSAMVADACDPDVAWTVEETVLVDLPNDFTIQRVYSTEDDCGNVATYTSTVTYVPVVSGCTAVEACNYDLYANLDDESCFFALPGFDCEGNCLTDNNDNGICDDLEIEGCTDPTNPGYNPAANVEDGSCLVGGCINVSACNYDLNADYQVAGSCEFTSCAGCLNVNACNYDSTASLSNGSCVYAVYGYDCDGNCLLDDDGDGICNQFEVPGCTDPTNPAYNPNATDDNGSCLTGGCTFTYACNYDPEADFLDITSCDFQTCAGCTDEDACNYDLTATLNVPTSCDFPESIFVGCDGLCLNDTDGDGICDEAEIPGCTDPAASNYSPFATDDNGTCITEVGGCTLPFACNFDPSADFYLPGSCDFTCLNGMPSNEGDCTDELACNYGVEGPCVYFDEEGQLCATVGCTNELACNFDPEAQINSGCDYTSCLVYGCTNANACNFNVEATTENGSCNYSSCVGCTDDGASNFDPDATIDNGQCQYDIYGCMTMMACNYNPEATVNDGTCDFAGCFGCVTPTACNYDEGALYPDGSCLFAPAGLDCDGNCLADLDGDMVCDADEVSGCTDEGALNYNPAASDDNGSCEYLTTGCTDQTACNFDYNAQVDNGSCDFNTCSGCIVSWACNYDDSATVNDGSCVFPDVNGVCPNGCESDLDGDGICDSDEVLGCVYANAINYDASATDDDGSCNFVGCVLPDYTSYNELANTNSGDCTNAPGSADFTGDGLVQLEDLLDFLVAFGTNGPDWGIDWVQDGCSVVAMGIAEMDVNTSGCTYPTASNYDPAAEFDTGSCVWLGCTDQEAYNFNHLATLDDSSCRYNICPDFNGDGQVQTQDLLDFLIAWGAVYE
jgi:hypothetical protein